MFRPARAVEPVASTPTLYIYDNYPGGVGLSEPLFDRQYELIASAHSLIATCDCEAGCPACVGPVLAADESGDDDTPKSLALRVLDELGSSPAAQISTSSDRAVFGKGNTSTPALSAAW